MAFLRVSKMALALHNLRAASLWYEIEAKKQSKEDSDAETNCWVHGCDTARHFGPLPCGDPARFKLDT
jgi:hypothetical protein